MERESEEAVCVGEGKPEVGNYVEVPPVVERTGLGGLGRGHLTGISDSALHSGWGWCL